MKHKKLSIGLFLSLLLVLFIFQNAAVVDISFLFWTFSMSRVLLLFLVFAIGLLVGWIISNLKTSSPDKEK